MPSWRLSLISTVERAIDLAKSGLFTSLSDVRQQLMKEGFAGTAVLFAGQSFKRQLNKLIGSAADNKLMEIAAGQTFPEVVRAIGQAAAPGEGVDDRGVAGVALRR